jgi:hypothetical protein
MSVDKSRTKHLGDLTIVEGRLDTHSWEFRSITDKEVGSIVPSLIVV